MKTRLAVMLVVCIAVMAVVPFIGPPMPPDARDFILWQLRILDADGAAGGWNAVAGGRGVSVTRQPALPRRAPWAPRRRYVGRMVAIVLGLAARCGACAITAAAFAFRGPWASACWWRHRAGRSVRMNDLVLAGIAFSAATVGPSSTGVPSADSTELPAATRWTMGPPAAGGLPGHRDAVARQPPCRCGGAAVAHARARGASRARSNAESQGVNVRMVRIIAIGLGAMGVAAVSRGAVPSPRRAYRPAHRPAGAGGESTRAAAVLGGGGCQLPGAV